MTTVERDLRSDAVAPRPRAVAGLWRRLAAFALDYFLIAGWIALVTVLGVVVRAASPDVASWLFGDPIRGEVSGFVGITLPVALYFTLSEQWPGGGTWGKRRLGLRVVTGAGEPLTLPRSLLRTGLKFLPWELTHAIAWRFAFPAGVPAGVLEAGLVLVWLLVAANVACALVDRQRRTLYDRLSGTRVIHRR